MTKPIIRIHNTETDKVIDREMSNGEFAEYEANLATNVIRQAEGKAKETAKAALLTKLGITAEEAVLLLL